ncbi:MAG: SCO family protein [Ignavibacteriae bacterium]|nr:MAG: SCO family protein [Ignavibacteriota bacterium]
MMFGVRRPSSIVLPLILSAIVTFSGCTGEEKIGEGGVDERNAAQKIEKKAPEFRGTDQSGAEFSTSMVKGRPWIATFFFTSCTTVCPALNDVQKQLVAEFGSKVRFVSISTDPETDTVERLAEYAARYGARVGTWWMVRMPADTMQDLASAGFGVMKPESPEMHTTRLVAVDASMNIAGYYDSSDNASVEQLKTWINSQP